MVIEDFNNYKRAKVSTTGPVSQQLRLAAPLDRLAAVVVDLCIVLLPPILLALAPFRKALTLAILFDNQIEFIRALILIALIAIGLVTTYHAVMFRYWGTTLGKMFFGLKVIDIWEQEKPNWSKAWIRSLGWVGSCLILGVPFLSILSNPRRRPLYDRMADTVVVTAREEGVSSPTPWEKTLAQSVFAVFIGALSVIFVVEIINTHRTLRAQAHLVNLLDSNGEVCESVGTALRKWPEIKGVEKDRLGVAMALFAAGLIDRSCLAAEVDMQFRGGHETDLAYLANSFVYAEKPQLSNAYLEKVCEVNPNSNHCHMSRIVDYWSEERWADVEGEFKKIWDSSDVYISVWAIRHFMNRDNFELAMSKIEQLSPQKSLASFLAKQRAKAYWGLKLYDQARAAAIASYDALDDSDRLDLASWICFEETEQSCVAFEHQSCRLVDTHLKDTPELLADARIALLQVRHSHCEPGKVPIGDLALNLRHAEVRSLAEAVAEMRQVKEPVLAFTTLREIINNSENEDVVRGEALRTLIRSSYQAEELHDLLKGWLEASYGLEWEKTGRALFAKFFQGGKYSESFKIGKRLYPYLSKEEKFQKEMVISAYRAGESQFAWGVIKDVAMTQSSQMQRAPSQVDEYSTVKRALEREFKGP